MYIAEENDYVTNYSTKDEEEMKNEKNLPSVKLTKRQATALKFVAEYMLEYGYPPTIREIGDHMAIKSTNGVNDHLKAIEKKGYITRKDAKSRAIRPLFMPDGQYFDEWLMDKKNMSEHYNVGEVVHSIPLVGKIAAGTPITAIENREEVFHVGNSLLNKAGKIFALRVSGESMIDDGIRDGDILFFKKVDSAADGSIVAVQIDGEATVKRIYHEGERVRLQPANETMEPIYITSEKGASSAVIGIAIALFRNM